MDNVIQEVQGVVDLIAKTRENLSTTIKTKTTELEALNKMLTQLSGTKKRLGRPKKVNGEAKVEVKKGKQTYAQKKLDTLGKEFTLDEARKAFRKAFGVSMAQLIRSGRVTKTSTGYSKA